MFDSMPWKRMSTSTLACVLIGLLASSFGCGKSGAPPETDMTEAAAAADPLSADALFRRSVEATGGVEILDRMTSSITKGTFSLPAMGMSGSLTLTQGPPGFSYMEIEIPGAGQILRGVRGDVAWELAVMSGPRILEGAEATSGHAPSRPQVDAQARRVLTRRPATPARTP